MEISQFAKSLLRSLTRSDVVDDGELLANRIKQYTMPAYKQAATVFKSQNTKNEVIKKINIAIHTGINEKLAGKRVIYPSGNLIENIDRALPVVKSNVETVAEMIDKTWNDKVLAAGLTYRNANLLQFISLAQFFERYARTYLNLVYIEESGMASPESVGFADMPATERKWVQDNAVAFGQALSIVAVKPENLATMMAIIPDISITNDNVRTAEAVLGRDAIDPMNMGFIPARIHPLYHLRMRWTDMQNKWHDEAKEDLARLQLRKLYLEEVKRGKGASVKVQKELEYTNNRINELKYKIAEAEAEAEGE